MVIRGLVKCIAKLGIATSKCAADLLKVEDVETHACAKYSRIYVKFVLLNAKPKKQALFMNLAQFEKKS